MAASSLSVSVAPLPAPALTNTNQLPPYQLKATSIIGSTAVISEYIDVIDTKCRSLFLINNHMLSFTLHEDLEMSSFDSYKTLAKCLWLYIAI